MGSFPETCNDPKFPRAISIYYICSRLQLKQQREKTRKGKEKA